MELFCYDQKMTIGIAGPVRREPWRGVVVALLGGAIVLVIGLVLLALASNFLVDWLWFGTLGYVSVFWTTIATEAAVFGIVFVATALSVGPISMQPPDGMTAFAMASPLRDSMTVP